MTDHHKHLVRTRTLPASEHRRISHPFNPSSELSMVSLGDRVGMARVQLSLVRIPPGKESFAPHSHAIQEEFLFILEGEGTALIDGVAVPVGPGDYMGFPTDGTPHHLINSGQIDLVYLMGGERTPVEVATFPTLGKIAVQTGAGLTFYDTGNVQHLPFEAWAAK